MNRKFLKHTLAATLALSATALGAAQADETLDMIGVSVSDLGNPFFVQVGKGVEAQAQQINPDAKVTVVSSNYDLATQMGQIDNFIAAGADMIILNAADPKGIFPAIRRAQEAGVVVVAVDVAAEGADITVTSDNTMAGRVACEYLAQRLEGKGDVVILNGPPVSAVVERVNGCKEVLGGYADITILSDSQNAGGSREGGLSVMTSLLSAYPKIDGAFAINDPTAVGADLAAKQAQRNEFIITSVDGAPSAEEVLKQEGSLVVATAAQNPNLMAQKGVELGYALMQGQEAEENPTLIPTPLVTRDNVGEYQGWGAK